MANHLEDQEQALTPAAATEGAPTASEGNSEQVALESEAETQSAANDAVGNAKEPAETPVSNPEPKQSELKLTDTNGKPAETKTPEAKAGDRATEGRTSEGKPSDGKTERISSRSRAAGEVKVNGAKPAGEGLRRPVGDNRPPTELRPPIAESVWSRRVLPYLTGGKNVEGVVITFTDITDQKQAAKELQDARRQADLANIAKSRFLAAASHDLRQPLQALHLLQGLLGKAVEGDTARRLVSRLDTTLLSMSGMLDTLLDINQIDAGAVSPDVADLSLNPMFDRLRDDFLGTAQAQGLQLRMVRAVSPCVPTIGCSSR